MSIMTFQDKLQQLGPTFRYDKGLLLVDGLPAREIADRYGTPTFCLSQARLHDNLVAFTGVFKEAYANTKFFYPLRANYLPSVLKSVASEGWGCEVASQFEYELALSSGCREILLDGYKVDIRRGGARDGVLVTPVIDSLDDARRLNSHARRTKAKIEVALRVGPDLGEFQSKALTSRGSKVGYDISSGDASRAAAEISRLGYISLTGLHAHAAIKESSPLLHLRILQSICLFADEITNELGLTIRNINIGGGFESRFLLESESRLETFASAFVGMLRTGKLERTLLLEPGRYIVGDSVIVLARVVAVKTNGRKKWIILDVGMNTLIPLKSAWFDVVPALDCDAGDMSLVSCNVGDYVSSPIGSIAVETMLPASVRAGDIVAVLNAGAYTLSMAEQFAMLRPTVVSVEDGVIRLIKKAERAASASRRFAKTIW
jgi:diaminopimelate decarboxylase